MYTIVVIHSCMNPEIYKPSERGYVVQVWRQADNIETTSFVRNRRIVLRFNEMMKARGANMFYSGPI